MTHPYEVVALSTTQKWLIYTGLDSFTVTWLFCTWHDAYIWLNSCIRGVTHLCVILVCHIWMHSYECVMPPTNESSHTWMSYRYDTRMRHIWMHSCVTWLVHTWHDAFIYDMIHSYVTWFIHVWHDSFASMCHTGSDVLRCHLTRWDEAWRIHVWHDLFIIWCYYAFISNMTHSYVTWRIHRWHDAFIGDMTHS